MIAASGEATGDEQRCILVDLDLHFGNAALTLGVDPGAGLAAMLASPDRLDEHLIAASLQPVNDRLSLIATQVPVQSDAPISPQAAMALVTALRSTAQWVVIDLPRTLDATARQLLRTADEVVLVAPPSLEGLRDMQRLLAWLVALRAGASPLVVVNGVGGGIGEVGRKLFEDTIGTGVAAWLPAQCGPAAAAAAHGLPLAAVAGGARRHGGNPYATLADRITGKAPVRPRLRFAGWWPKR
jgi:pilus assembly protein CpaE